MKVMNTITMKLLCLIFLVTSLPKVGSAQYAGDTVVVYIDNRIEMKIAVKDYELLRNSDEEVKMLEEFNQVLPNILEQLNPASADLITFNPNKDITVEPGDPRYNFLIKDGAVSNTGYRDMAILQDGETRIFLTASDLSRLTGHSPPSCLEKIKAQLPEKNRHSRTLYYECKDDKITYLEDRSTTNRQLDMLSLSVGAGAGLVKSNWVADLTFEVGLSFNKKGVLRHNAYLSSNLLFDFIDPGKMNINTFLNAGFRWNLDKNEETPDWLGLEIGYLVRKEGNLFGENTFRLGLNWSMIKGRSITVSPHLYMTDNFKTVYPGIRVGFGL